MAKVRQRRRGALRRLRVPRRAVPPDDYRSNDGDKSLPVFITDYPLRVSPLARRKDARSRRSSIASSSSSTAASSATRSPSSTIRSTRPRASAPRSKKKARGDEETMDYDEDYVRALEHGMPPPPGFGMGIDRLDHDAHRPAVDPRRHPLSAASPGETPGRREPRPRERPIVIGASRSVDASEPLAAVARAAFAAICRRRRLLRRRGVVDAACRSPHGSSVQLKHEVIRYAAAGDRAWCSSSCLLVALLPWLLDRLEGRSVRVVRRRAPRARQKSGFLTVISVLSICGVAVSSCALCARQLSWAASART